MNKGVPATLDDVILSIALAECAYPAPLGAGGPSREDILAMSAVERRDLIDMDRNRELVESGAEIYHAEISVGELDDCYYRNTTPWTAFTDGTLLVRDGAKELDALDDFNRGRVEWTLDQGEPYPPLVLVSPADEGPHVIVHGAASATAIVRRHAPERLLDAFWTIAPLAEKWPWWPPTRGA
jgi:hypothetical protein